MTRDEALQDPDLAQVGQALARAARRAREVALRTHTSFVFLRNGVTSKSKGTS